MKLIMVAAVSQDEFITKDQDSDISSWTSEADKQFFADIKSKHTLFIMGLNTYKSAPIKPELGILRVVLAHQPEKYQNQEVKGQLEFVSLSPEEIVNKYKNRFHSGLVLGGSNVYQEFLDANLIHEIYLTVEPVMHLNGIHLLSSGKKLSDLIPLSEPEITKLNITGTILKHFCW